MDEEDISVGSQNRDRIIGLVKQAICNSLENEKYFTVLYLEMDNFRSINSTFGYAEGNYVLKELINRILRIIGYSDLVVRAGGDEYVVVIHSIDNYDSVEKVAEKVRNVFTKAFSIKKNELCITASIGCTVYPKDGADENTLIVNAVLAMNKAKEEGCNRIVYYENSMRAQMLEELDLTNKLYTALENDEFELYYQPIVNSITDEIVAVESLIRWNLPGIGVVGPNNFIPIAEKTGLINSIGKWVIKTACMQNKSWQAAGYPFIPVAVNISAQQLNDISFVNYVEKCLDNTKLSPQYLKMEVTENVAINEIKPAIEILKQLDSLGLRIAIDDFGTAYSSLNYIKHLPIDTIKIDKCFIDGINDNSKDEAIIKSIISLANELELNVIAEGVEKRHQIDFLKNENCNMIQGYYYYKPMPVGEVEKNYK